MRELAYGPLHEIEQVGRGKKQAGILLQVKHRLGFKDELLDQLLAAMELLDYAK